MANALLERTIEREAEQHAGWAAAAPAGPRESVRDAPMTMGGVASATGVLFVILLGTGVWGWSLVDSAPPGEAEIPGWLLPAVLGAFVLAIVAMFKPPLARFLGPVYAAIEGLALGAISHVYENEWDGIVVQAVGLTTIVFATMLFLYGTRIVRVTERMRRVIIGATIAIMVFYGISLLLSLLDVEMPLIWDAGPFGILFSLFVCGLAAFNLMLDFDLAERGVQAGLPKYMEWFVALGLMVSIVWLYLEILRLLAKLRSR
ncbi:MAG: Bax inhibitor-1/YccA family protein [Actinomycetota bacterium]